MTVSARKITAFAKLVAGLADTPNLGSTTLLKQWFDSSPEELRVAVNGLIDDLIATAAGSSGTEQIGSAPITGVAGATAYAQLVDLKNQLTSAVMGSLNTETKSALTQKIGFINGNFDIWQRGITQILTTSGAYFPDRWSISNYGGNTSGIKVDQGSLTPPMGSSYYLRYRLSTASAITTSLGRLFRYRMEAVDVQKLIGNQVTVSFKVRSNIARNFSYSLNVYGFTGVDNGTNGTGLITGDADYGGNTVGLTANTWTTITKTFIVQDPATGTGLAANGISIELNGRYTTLGAEVDTEYQFAQIQLDIGSIALPFRPKSFADELALCQRYYEKSYDYGTIAGASTPVGAMASFAYSASTISGFRFKAIKRISSPTVSIYSPSGTSGKVWSSSDVDISSGMAAFNIGDSGCRYMNATGAGLTSGGLYNYHYTVDAEI